MNKSQIIAAYERFRKQYRLTAKELVLSAGGALLLMGLRQETEDLDLDIPEELYDRLKRKLPKVGNDQARLVNSPLGEHIVLGDCALHWGLRTDIKTVVINGVCCYSPADLLAQKQALVLVSGRPIEKVEQDQADIVNLQVMTRKLA